MNTFLHITYSSQKNEHEYCSVTPNPASADWSVAAKHEIKHAGRLEVFIALNPDAKSPFVNF